MSHQAERREKVCLNCNTFIYGRYCHKCGQENIEPAETFWDLVTHFVYDITHFDGKFFSTVRYLLTKPGFLSLEYIKGKRMSYLNPIRMYVFTSAFFFLFFFSIVKSGEVDSNTNSGLSYAQAKARVDNKKASVDSALAHPGTPAVKKTALQKQLALVNSDLERLKADTTHLETLYSLKGNSPGLVTAFDRDTVKYNSLEEYKLRQANLPKKERDGWLKRLYKSKKISIENKYGHDQGAMVKVILTKFTHTFPQLLFVSLPLFALLLRLLYRRKKEIFYASHLIYSIHLYCAMFLLIFLYICLNRLEVLPYFRWVDYLVTLLAIYMLWYFYKSLRRFYQQRRGKTIFKFFLLILSSGVVMLILFGVFFTFSVFSI